MQAEDAVKQLHQDLGVLHHFGLKIVLVMGATAQIDQALQAQSIPWDVHQQFRITTAKMIPIFQQTIGAVRSQLEATFSQANGTQAAALTLTSGNWVTAQPKGVIEGVDFQHTGRLRKINHQAISACLEANQIALLTPLAYSLTGEVFNLNTLEQACEVANAIQADKLMIFGSDQHLKHLPKQLSAPEMANCIAKATDPVQKRFLSQVAQTNATVKRIHLMNQSEPSSILIELFTRDGAGTLIFRDRYHQLRTATIDDVGGILDLISPLEAQGILVKRSRERLELEIENFIVVERDEHIIGCAALYPASETMGELACLAVSPHYQGQELGLQLLNSLEVHAKQMGLTGLFLLTTQTEHWFVEHGFKVSSINSLPDAKQPLYNLQRQSKILIKPLS